MKKEQKLKVMTELKNLLGFESIEELADVFNLTKETAYNLNSTRAGGNLLQAYKIILKLFSLLNAEERAILTPLSKKSKLNEKLERLDQIERQLKKIQKKQENHQNVIENFFLQHALVTGQLRVLQKEREALLNNL